MAGFENNVLVCENVNFNTGLPNPHPGLITTDGQLIIGTTTPNAGGTHLSIGNITSLDSSITVTNGSGTIDLSANGGLPYYSLTPLIVGADTHSQYTTITAALAAAPANSYIFVKPGTYTENLNITSNVNINAFSATGDFLFEGGVTLIGQVTVANGIHVGFNGIDFQSAVASSSFSLTNACDVAIQNSILEPLSGTSLVINNATANVSLENCQANLSNSGKPYTVTSGVLRIKNCSFNSGNNSTTIASDVASGFVHIIGSVINCPVTTSSSGIIYAQNSIFGDPSLTNQNLTWVTTAGTGTSYFNGCFFGSGTASAMSIGAGTTAIVVHTDLNSSNANVLTGAGTLQYALVSFSGSSSGHNVTTETGLPTLL